MDKVLFSSQSMEWSTPQWLFDELDSEFHFTLDPCSTEQNHKCPSYFTQADNGLIQDWGGHTVFCNPPYGKEIGKWVEKCYREATKDYTTCVLLIPARTDTAYFQDYINGRAEVRYLQGRLYYNDGSGRAPFPSIICIFRGPKVRHAFGRTDGKRSYAPVS